MTTRPHIIVAGLARCGTTLTMTMLHAAGIPCIGERPAFEVGEINHNRVDPAFLARYPGHAFKLLDPDATPLPPLESAAVIWLDRDPYEQAKSQIKFNAMLMPGLMVEVGRAQRRRWAAGLTKDRLRALAALPNVPTLVMRFEALIRSPRDAANSISRFLYPWWPQIDAEKMARQVRPRSADCAPGLDIELALSDEAGVS